MRERLLGEQAMALLNFIAAQGEATVGEVSEGFGEPNGLSRSTVVTMMDRLRAQGHLTRVKGEDGVFRYRTVEAQEAVLDRIATRFIDKILAGRLTAFSAYFTRSSRLSDAEKAELKRLLQKMEGSAEAPRREERRRDDQ